jgi:hypothetical protein
LSPCFSTKQAEVEVALQTNVESDVAIQITEKTDDRPQGVVLELFRVFVAQRNPQALLEKLPFLALEFGVHSDAATHWFVLCDSGSVYCEPHEQAVADAFSELEKRMERFDDQLVTGARHLEVPLVPFAQSGEKERSAFWSSLLVQPLLLERAKAHKAPVQAAAPAPEALRFGDAKLGRGKDKTLFHEPLVLLKKTLVQGGSSRDREWTVRILMESALLSGIPVLIFDAADRFRGLREQNPDPKAVSESGFDLSPAGFPTEDFGVPSGAWADFAALDIEAMLELFRIGHTPSAKVLKMVFDLGVAASWTQMIDTIKVQSPAGDVTRFHLNKAMRIAAVLDALKPGFFAGPNRIDALAKTVAGGFGHASVVSLRELDPRLRLVLAHSVCRELKRSAAPPAQPKPVSALVVFPDAAAFFPSTGHERIQQAIIDDLFEAANYGVGLVMSAEKSIDLNDRVQKEMTAEIGIVSGRDVGIRIEKRKPYRCELRVPLSRL